jgi:hypothetical protein
MVCGGMGKPTFDFLDGRSAYTNLVKGNPAPISPIYGWAHVRRKLKEALASPVGRAFAF